MESKEKYAQLNIPELEKRLEDKITHKIIKRITDVLEEEFYPPEEMIREEFIKDVEAAQNRVKHGKSKVLSPEEFKAKFCG
ncbi:Uncharacterised protein [uncultured archaeon]|nr:Uncharacterised protein [uncultured archaeon]